MWSALEDRGPLTSRAASSPDPEALAAARATLAEVFDNADCASPERLNAARQNCTLRGVHLELPVPDFVSRTPTPAGATLRFGGRGRTARCHRCCDASTPP
jgi:hypothetical protein